MMTRTTIMRSRWGDSALLEPLSWVGKANASVDPRSAPLLGMIARHRHQFGIAHYVNFRNDFAVEGQSPERLPGHFFALAIGRAGNENFVIADGYIVDPNLSMARRDPEIAVSQQEVVDTFDSSTGPIDYDEVRREQRARIILLHGIEQVRNPSDRRNAPPSSALQSFEELAKNHDGPTYREAGLSQYIFDYQMLNRPKGL